MQAFFNDPAIKDKYVTRAQAHLAADEIIQGVYVGTQEDGRPGYCCVGCLIEGSDHRRFETEMGIPRSIARLADIIHERLPDPDFKTWPTQFIEAVPVGADLSLVTAKFMLWLLSDPEHGVLRFATTERTQTAIQAVINLYQKQLSGQEPTTQQWADAADAADAARAAAYAARAAAYAAADAADAARAAYAARFKYSQAMRDQLLHLLATA